MIESDRIPGAKSMYATVDDRQVHYLQAGDAGPPVVLLHGSGIDDAAMSWKRTIPALAQRHRVYALDWPGYGESDDPGDKPTAAYFTRVLAGFLDAVGLGRAALVGISMGGSAALGVAVEAPDRVTALALVDSYGLTDAVPGGAGTYLLANTPFAGTLGRQFLSGSTAGARSSLGMFVHDVDACTAEFVADVEKRLQEPDAFSSFMAFQRAEFRPNGVRTHYTDDLADLQVPTLLVHGAEDPLIPLSWTRNAAEAIPNAELAVIPECGHWPPRERPEAFLEALGPFLERTTR